jgi:hypothetical protein
MPAKPRALLLFSTLIGFPLLVAFCQDAPSLGDTARRTRQEKPKTSPGSETAAPKGVKITDEDTPQSPQQPAPSSATSDQKRPAGNNTPTASRGVQQTAEQWKAQIQAQKTGIAQLQAAIDKLNDSIHFVAANCNGCQQWNERQLEKKQEVERARSQLEEQKKRLADMQEAARQQGYGSSVYDP